jgi:lipoate-protein ligase A
MGPKLHLDTYVSTGSPSRDLAFEGDMLSRAATGRETLLVTSWPGPVVVLGYAQPPTEANLSWCRERSIPVLRRLSGGTGVIHRGDLGVSLALPRKHPWAGAIIGLYERFLGALIPALTEVGSRVERVGEPRRATRVRSPICFEDQLADTLVVDGRKAVGCSQTRRKGGVLIHAAVMLNLEPALYAGVFGVSEERVRRGLAPAVTGVGIDRITAAVIRRLAEKLDRIPTAPRVPSPSSEQLAVYGQERWAPVADDGMG